MRKIAGVLFGAAVVFTSTLPVTTSAWAAEIRIGVIAPSSGPIAAQGKRTDEGIRAGVAYVSRVKNNDLKLIQLDDASNPSLTARNAKKLIEQEQVDVLIGTGGVPGSLALATIAREAQVPLMSYTPIDLDPKTAEWGHTTAQSGDTMISAVVKQMVKDGVKTVAYVGFSDAWGDSAYAALEKYAGPAGLQIVANERYARSDNSVTGQILKVMTKRPDAVLGAGAGTPGALPFIELADRKYGGRLYGTHAILSPEFVKLVGAAGEGIVVPTGPVLVGDQLPDAHPSRKIIGEYNQAYEKANGAKPYDVFSSYAFDAWMLVAKAAEQIPADVTPGTPAFRDALHDQINKLTKVEATQGTFSFTPESAYGTGLESVIMVRLEKGSWSLLKD